MKIHIELTEHDLKKLIIAHIENKTEIPIKETDINFLVKTTQNFKAEWETGKFKAIFETNKI